MTSRPRGRITAVLGPTNTGKTHLAIERMLGHASGIIGFPLRLLARENYDRALKAKGRGQVALVTGEEKIVPPGARYFFCTVESMPVDRPVDFLAVDEIQLAADPERGHVFTDRLLRARGLQETMFLGAGTIARLIRDLVPEAQKVTRPRLSTLSYAGPRKVTRLPPRSAAVAFSAAGVYELAEVLRRQRGGTAVVLGALSPRTRNAQVGMFEAGEVDYLVATDAIGMGLNLSLDHVAFTRLVKFDGRHPRRLSPPEVAQIAGRAGRHMSNGTFGTTAELGPMEPELVEAVESHRFDPITGLYWRNSDLDFRSAAQLQRSLERRPPDPCLLRVREPDDQRALAALLHDPEAHKRAGTPEALRLLWEVCQIPDFRKILSDQHARLLGQVFRHLRDGEGRLPNDWVARQIARIDRDDGDIDTLVARIAHVRTWTYISHRADWLEAGAEWQERTRALEDKLSDALHARLTQRFVDRRAAALVRRLAEGGELIGALRSNGEVVVEGEFVGRLAGFRFELDPEVAGEDAKPLLAAARRVLASAVPARLRDLEVSPDGVFSLGKDGRILWQGAAVARLAPGPEVLKPAVQPLASDFLDGPARERLRRRLDTWLQGLLRRKLAPLYRLREAGLDGAGLDGAGLNGTARGVAFQLAEALGCLPRSGFGGQLESLDKADRKALGDLGVRLGMTGVFLVDLLRSRTAPLRGLLWCVHAGRPAPELPPAKAKSFAVGAGLDPRLCQAMGFRRLGRDGGRLAIRADALERLAREARKLSRQGSFAATPALCRLIDAEEAELRAVLSGLGYQETTDDQGSRFETRAGRRGLKGKTAGKRRRGKPPAHSPFAKLRDLGLAEGRAKGRAKGQAK